MVSLRNLGTDQWTLKFGPGPRVSLVCWLFDCTDSGELKPTANQRAWFPSWPFVLLLGINEFHHHDTTIPCSCLERRQSRQAMSISHFRSGLLGFRGLPGQFGLLWGGGLKTCIAHPSQAPRHGPRHPAQWYRNDLHTQVAAAEVTRVSRRGPCQPVPFPHECSLSMALGAPQRRTRSCRRREEATEVFAPALAQSVLCIQPNKKLFACGIVWFNSWVLFVTLKSSLPSHSTHRRTDGLGACPYISSS